MSLTSSSRYDILTTNGESVESLRSRTAHARESLREVVASRPIGRDNGRDSLSGPLPREIRRIVAAAALLLSISATTHADQNASRIKARAFYDAFHYKDAYELLHPLCLDPASTSAVSDASMALRCLTELSRSTEADELRDSLARTHSNNWELLTLVATSYQEANPFGAVVSGEFIRGGGYESADPANVIERDRVRALQLMRQALPFVSGTQGGKQAGAFFQTFADILVSRRTGAQTWRLQELTPLKELPDWEPGHRSSRAPTGSFAPVDTNGNPILYPLPASFDTARNDGERWRWLLTQSGSTDTNRTDRVLLQWADFLNEQFGVRTMAPYGWFTSRPHEFTNSASLFALETLRDDETIAALACGPRRFTLPDEYNYIAICKSMTARKGWASDNAIYRLAEEYERRHQYAKAAEWWRRSIADHGDKMKLKSKRLNQIVGNWGRFETTWSAPAGTNATVRFRFRNASKISLLARRLDARRLLFDLRSRIRAHDSDNEMYDPEQYIADKVQDYLLGVERQWALALTPPPDHSDAVVEVNTGLSEAGAYLLTARLEDGNESRIVLWLDDTAIVSKQLDRKSTALFVLDARTGAPLPDQEVILFGYGHDYDPFLHSEPSQTTRRTDANGRILLPANRLEPYARSMSRWLVTVNGDHGRFAFVNWAHIWGLDGNADSPRSFLATDRPLYRPGHEVKFRVWADTPQYGRKGMPSVYAGLHLSLEIFDPNEKTVWQGSVEADDSGGVAGVWTVPENAPLGVYNMTCTNIGVAGTFRVEEYRKPEFEVTVRTPETPPLLGDRLRIQVASRYYFGKPVTVGTIRYEVRRTAATHAWYPPDDWDWLYGPGYWWFDGHAPWRSGWIGNQGQKTFRHDDDSPDGPFKRDHDYLVAQGEVTLGTNGITEFWIDTTEARAVFGNTDHVYDILVEVTDASRRTVKSHGRATLARTPFEIHLWPDRGHHAPGEEILIELAARTIDGTPVPAKGFLNLHRILADDGRVREETESTVPIGTDSRGMAAHRLTIALPGQYRVSCALNDRAGRAVEVSHAFTVLAPDGDSHSLLLPPIEIIPDKKRYSPGEQVNLRIQTAAPDSTVLLFIRSSTNFPAQSAVLRLRGQSARFPIPLTVNDVPNLFVQAVTVRNGTTYEASRMIAIPPAKRILDMDVRPNRDDYAAGDEAEIAVSTRDASGEPCSASVALTVYDRSLEMFPGVSSAPDIREVFWKWLWSDNPRVWKSTGRSSPNITSRRSERMRDLDDLDSLRWETWQDELYASTVHWRVANLGPARPPFEMRIFDSIPTFQQRRVASVGGLTGDVLSCEPMPSPGGTPGMAGDVLNCAPMAAPGGTPDMGAMSDFAAWAAAAAIPLLRDNFADSAFWTATLRTDSNGQGSVRFRLPHNLTTWQIRAWAVANGTRVGQGSARMTTRNGIIARIETPRFLVEKDETIVSVIVHNYLDAAKKVGVVLDLDGNALALPTGAKSNVWVAIGPDSEQRVDWRVRAATPGEAVIRARALTDTCSDAVESRFPVLVHGMERTRSFSGCIRPDATNAVIELGVPAERRAERSRFVVRYSPTLAGAILDAIPYLIDYPYGCAEQTLNRFVPAVVARGVLDGMDLDLDSLRARRANLNAQELGSHTNRMAERGVEANPVFDRAELDRFVKVGVESLAGMQRADGDWGWFAGREGHADPYITALVVHGLQIAAAHGVRLPPGLRERGWSRLSEYQEQQTTQLRMSANRLKTRNIGKKHADDTDAFVFHVLAEGGLSGSAMRDFLYRDRDRLTVYGKVLLALGLERTGRKVELATVTRNIEQYLTEDTENQTACLKQVTADRWSWRNDRIEANAHYLKLLVRIDPRGARTAAVAKYLVNNRGNGSHWRSTRDTALCVEALSEFIRATGEAKPDMTIEVLLDDELRKSTRIGPGDLLTFDGTLVLSGAEVASGSHRLEVRRRGKGPVYFNAYLTDFTVEDPISKAGVEIQIDRRFYRLIPEGRTVTAPGPRGESIKQNVGGFHRESLTNLAEVKSGDLVEVELVTESRNDYEYLLIEDRKPAGFEPEKQTSGYTGNSMGAYVEFRDDRVCFFLETLTRGTHSGTYRIRAETPGTYSALPARIHAMYAPELTGNSDEMKTRVTDDQK